MSLTPVFHRVAWLRPQAEELGNQARELKGLIDDSESVIFINLDRYAVD